MDADLGRYCARLGRHIRELRVAAGFTQEDMIERGFSLRHYQRIEAGRSITVATILKLANAFDVEPREVLPLSSTQRRT